MRLRCLAAVVVLAAVLAGTVSATDADFSNGGYMMSAIGSSSKLRLQVSADSRYLQISQDRLKEVATDGSTLRQISSFASTDLSWTNSAVTCGDAPSVVAVRVCGDTGSVGSSVDNIHLQGDLTNASFYSDCSCGSSAFTAYPVSEEAKVIIQPFDDNYNANVNGFCYTCENVCVTCTSTSACTASAATAGCSFPTRPFGARIATDGSSTLCTGSCVCVNNGDNSVTACAADESCAAGTTKYAGELAGDHVAGTTDFVSTQCSFTYHHLLKFGIAVTGWNWDSDTTSQLQWGVEVKGSGGLTTGSSGTVTSDDGLELLSNPDYLRCPSADSTPCTDLVQSGQAPDCDVAPAGKCCWERDGVTRSIENSGSGSSKKIVTLYRFANSHGSSSICYDPTIGEISDSSAASVGVAVSFAVVALACLLNLAF